MLHAPSPRKATVSPASSPRCSRIVIRSASSWQGWKSSVSALTTGTPGVRGHRLEVGLGEGAPDDRRGLAAEDPGDVRDRLAHADAGQRAVDEHRVAAELGDAGGERRPACAGWACRRSSRPCGAVERARSKGSALIAAARSRTRACSAGVRSSSRRKWRVTTAPPIQASSRIAGQAARKASASSSVSTRGGARRIRSGGRVVDDEARARARARRRRPRRRRRGRGRSGGPPRAPR